MPFVARIEHLNEVTLRQMIIEEEIVDQTFDIYDEIKRDDRLRLTEEVSIKDLAPFLCCPLKCFLVVSKATLSYL